MKNELKRSAPAAQGVAAEHIDVCPLCTACRPDLYWSHRKMGNHRGVQGALIGLVSGEEAAQ